LYYQINVRWGHELHQHYSYKFEQDELIEAMDCYETISVQNPILVELLTITTLLKSK
jgi:hypothetical protein